MENINYNNSRFKVLYTLILSGAFIIKRVVWQHSNNAAWNTKDNVGVTQHCGACAKSLCIVGYRTSLVIFHFEESASVEI